MAISAAQVMELRNITGAGMMDCKKALLESEGDLSKAGDYLRKKGVAVAAKKSGRDTNEGAVAMAFSDDRKTAALVQLACETDFVARNENFQSLIADLAAQVLANGDEDVENQTMAEGGTAKERLTEEIGRMGENLRLLESRRMTLDGDGMIGGYVHSNGKIGVLIALAAEGSADREKLRVLAKDLAMHIAATHVSGLTPEEIDPAVLEKEREFLVAQAKESGKPDDIVDKMVEGRIKKFIAERTLLSQPFVKDPEKTVSQYLADSGKEIGANITPTAFVKLQI